MDNYPQGAGAPGPMKALAVDQLLEEIGGLNNRLDGYGGLLTSIADRWFGPVPPAPPIQNQANLVRPANEMPPRLAQLELLVRTGHQLAQRIEAQLDRLRTL